MKGRLNGIQLKSANEKIVKYESSQKTQGGEITIRKVTKRTVFIREIIKFQFAKYETREEKTSNLMHQAVF